MKIIVMLAVVLANFVVEAQVKTPQASPLAKIDQIVGLTNVQIEYSRPSAKGRTVYGDLVPYGKNWRTLGLLGVGGYNTIAYIALQYTPQQPMPSCSTRLFRLPPSRFPGFS